MLSSPDVALIGKAALATILGFAVGFERERHGHAAGMRTLALVAMGAAVFTGISLGAPPLGPDRVIQGIVQGIGFLGAGVILRAPRGGIQGLTTAATVWTEASVGVTVGVGRYLDAVALTALLLIILWWPYLSVLARVNSRARHAQMGPDNDARTDV